MEKESLVNEVGIDFCYVGPLGEGVPMLVARDRPPPLGTGSYAATFLSSKGRTPYGIAFLVGWFRGLGYKKVVVRSDNERALLSLVSAVSEIVMQCCGFV